MDIIDKLNEQRKKKKISVDKLARATGLSYRHVYCTLHHQVNPGVKTLEKIARYLDMKLYVK